MASRSIKNRPSIKKKHPFVGLLAFLSIIAAICLAGCIGVVVLGDSWIGDLKTYDVSEVSELNTSAPTTVLASDEQTQLARFQVENREPVELSGISKYVMQGTVATEDERFYDHGGFDLVGIARAAFVTLTGSGREGASTITQQFVRNTVLADEMNDISLKRKVREMYLSVKIEEMYSKNDILLMYLNTVNYGSGAYGIQAASQRYFSKDATDLTLAEAAALVGIPQSPTYNNPIDYPDNCYARRNLVLDRMLTNGYITQEEHDSAKAQDLVLNPSVPSSDGIEKYPYFTSYVKNVLSDQYSQLDVFKGGLTVVTTLDVDTQEAAEDAVRTKEEGLSDAISGSLVAIDPSTGFIRALVGGKDWDTQKTNLATGEGTNGGRPCGSSFKTFTLIAALEEGIDPQTMVDCSSPSVIPDTGYDSSNPLQNINNINYGTRSIARAFAVSSNTGFVRLQMALGTQKVIDAAKKMGITSTLNANPSLTLGQSNVTMLDMADAYACIANGGTKYDAQPILKIYDKNNNLIVDNSHPSGTQVISAEVAHAATEVMKGVVNTSEGTGTLAKLDNGQEVAAKTGTSSEYHDITFCGITPQLSVAIWFGDPSNQETIPTDVSAADVFKKFMTAALYDKQTETFPQASNPTYKAFSNATYHIGTTSSSPSSSSANSAGNSSNNQYGNSTGSSNSQSDTANGSGNSNSYGTGNANGNASGGTGSGSGGETGGGTTGGATGGGTGAATGGTTGGGGTGSATGGGTASGGASTGGGAATQ